MILMDILISFQETKILNADIGKRNKQPRGCEQHPLFLLQIPPPKRPAFFVFYSLSNSISIRSINEERSIQIRSEIHFVKEYIYETY